MSEIKRECVSRITYSIALEAIPLLFVADSELESRLTLKADGLFVDGNKDAGDPHVLGLLVKLVNQALDLPKWILPLLLPRKLTVVLHCKVTAEVFPAPSCLDHLPRHRILPLEHIAVDC